LTQKVRRDKLISRCPEIKSGFIPHSTHWQLQMRPSGIVVDGLISCEYSNEIIKEFVIGGGYADSKSNGPQGPQE
jgi:hypothetical protein